jgi:hypothetical protein
MSHRYMLTPCSVSSNSQFRFLLDSVKAYYVRYGDARANISGSNLCSGLDSLRILYLESGNSLYNCGISSGQVFHTGVHTLTLVPRTNAAVIPYSSQVFLLHPSFPGVLVAEGRVGASWKNTKGLLGPLCEPGQQMVALNKVVITGVPLMFLETRHHAKTLDGALTPSGQKPMYIKWDIRYMHKKP